MGSMFGMKPEKLLSLLNKVRTDHPNDTDFIIHDPVAKGGYMVSFFPFLRQFPDRQGSFEYFLEAFASAPVRIEEEYVFRPDQWLVNA